MSVNETEIVIVLHYDVIHIDTRKGPAKALQSEKCKVKWKSLCLWC